MSLELWVVSCSDYDLSGPLSGTIAKNAHRVSGQDLQILHEKVELYRLSIGFGSGARRFGGQPASIPMCSGSFLRYSSAAPDPAGPVLSLVVLKSVMGIALVVSRRSLPGVSGTGT